MAWIEPSARVKSAGLLTYFGGFGGSKRMKFSTAINLQWQSGTKACYILVAHPLGWDEAGLPFRVKRVTRLIPISLPQGAGHARGVAQSG